MMGPGDEAKVGLDFDMLYCSFRSYLEYVHI